MHPCSRSLIGAMTLLLFAGSTGCRSDDSSAKELEKIVALPHLDFSQYSETQSYAKVTGRWVLAENPSGTRPTIPVVNTVEIECEKATAVCTEHVAMLWGEGEGYATSPTSLWLFQGEYRIVRWGDGRIDALDDALVADVWLHLSLSERSAERRHQEKRSSDGKQGNPEVRYRWVLKGE